MRRIGPARGLGVALAGVLAVAACSPDTTGPTGAEDAALTTAAALVAADGAQRDLDRMGGLPDRPEPNRTVTFYDAAGSVQAKYDSLTTASIRTQSSVDDEMSRDGFVATVHRASDITVSGLAGKETQRTWSGTSDGTVTRSRATDAGVTRSFTMTETEKITNVVHSLDRATHPWPLSGTITRTLHVVEQGPAGERTKDVTTVITFDGTSGPTLTIDGVAHVLDLGDRKGPLPFRRK